MQVDVYLKTHKVTLRKVNKEDIDRWTSARLIDYPYANGRLIIPFSSVSHFMVTDA
jgi:hypothetical protein